MVEPIRCCKWFRTTAPVQAASSRSAVIRDPSHKRTLTAWLYRDGQVAVCSWARDPLARGDAGDVLGAGPRRLGPVQPPMW